ncbi:MAG TPA: Crp/Fnr family transcriptional regulator [Actinomycetota bacterium]|nr:Crp/Fnr family transcriptional regulator [Actinomycetota bacterium]
MLATDAGCPVLVALREPERARLLERAVPRALAAGEVLYLSGDRTGRVHLVQTGVLKLGARDADGRDTLLGLAVPGDLVGELAALDDLPQPLDAIAATAAEVVGFDASVLVDVLRSSPPASLELARTLSSRMRWVCGAAVERTSGDVAARLAGRLLELADVLGVVRDGALELDLPVAQDDLGRLAGMCRESACKTLRRFKERGVLDYRGRTLRLLRPEQLEQIRRRGRAAPVLRRDDLAAARARRHHALGA